MKPTVTYGRFTTSATIVGQSKKWSMTIHTLKWSTA